MTMNRTILILLASFRLSFSDPGDVTRDIYDAMQKLNTGMDTYEFPELLEGIFDCMNRVNPDLLPATVRIC